MATKPKHTSDIEKGNYLPVESGPSCQEIWRHVYPKLVIDCGQACMIIFGILGIAVAVVIYLGLWIYIGYKTAGLLGMFVSVIPAFACPTICRWLYIRYRDGMHELQAIRIGTELQEVNAATN